MCDKIYMDCRVDKRQNQTLESTWSVLVPNTQVKLRGDYCENSLCNCQRFQISSDIINDGIGLVKEM